MTQFNKSAVIPLVLFLTLLAIGVTMILKNPHPAGDENPYQYDISKYKVVPADLIKWTEETPIQLDKTHIPQALAIAPSGGLVIGTNAGILLYRGGRFQTINDFNEPTFCLVFRADGRLYAGVNGGIVVFDSEFGEVVQRIDLGERARLTSLSSVGNTVFVADFGQRRVWRLNVDDTPETMFSGPKGVFSLPSPYFDVATVDERVWIVDPGRHTLTLYDQEFKDVQTWGKTGMGLDGFSGCCNPTHIAVQSDGSLVTLEKGLPRIRIFETDGTLREFVSAPDSLSGTMPASDLTVLPDGRIAVLDPFKKQVRLFRRTQETPVSVTEDLENGNQ